MTEASEDSNDLGLARWLLGLAAISALTGLVVAWMGVSQSDRLQQVHLVLSLGDGNLKPALEPLLALQTAGPGYGLVAAPLYRLFETFLSPPDAYDVASYAIFLLLGVAVIAASRAVGVAARSGRELVNVAAAMLGVPVLACYTELFHPADLLASIACLAAFAAVCRGRIWTGAAFLGFAVVTKQWAVVVVLVLAALLERRERSHLVAGAALTTAALLLPFAITNPSATLNALNASSTYRGRTMAAALVPLPHGALFAASRMVPLVLAAVWSAWLFWKRARFEPQLAATAIAVALVFRPLMDPAGFIYYLAPAYVFAVLIQPRSWRWPVGCVVGGALIWFRRSLDDGRRQIFHDGAPMHLSDDLLAVATTAVVAVAAVLAVRRVVQLIAEDGSDPVGSGSEAPAGGPGDLQRGDGVLG